MVVLRGQHPQGWLIVTVIMYSLCALSTFGVVASNASAAQSSYVQAHGMRDSATVVSEDDIAHWTKQSGTTYTSLVNVQLQQPVHGTTRSVVHVPYAAGDLPGGKVTVLVNPRNPGYSELPGSADTTNGSWIQMLVLALLTLVIAIVSTRRTRRLFRQRRAGDVLGTGNRRGLVPRTPTAR